MNAERRFLILSIALPPLVLAAFMVGYFAKPTQAAGTELDPVAEAYARIHTRYNGDVEGGQLKEGAIEGMLKTLDPYCEYYTVEEWRKFDTDELKGKFGGVGIVVEFDTDSKFIRVVTVIPRTPASKTSILPNDLITHVDGKSLKDEGVRQAVKLIRGEVGSPVKLTLYRKVRGAYDETIKRGIVKVPALQTKMLDEEKGLGYMRIIKFQELTEEFDKKFTELSAQGLKALIVDLRFNGGGLLRECVTLSDRFLSKGKIVSTRGKTSRDNYVYEARKDGTLVDGSIPVVVLVNDSTASASEIFAGAMKDHKRATLVGTRTYGKGTVQTPMELSDGSWLKITTARYYTPNGVSVHRQPGKKEYGLDPDYLIETTDEETAKIFQRLQSERYGQGKEGEFEDLQLKAAVEIAEAALDKREPKVERRVIKKDENPRD